MLANPKFDGIVRIELESGRFTLSVPNIQCSTQSRVVSTTKHICILLESASHDNLQGIRNGATSPQNGTHRIMSAVNARSFIHDKHSLVVELDTLL